MSDGFPGGRAWPAYDELPKWRPIEECNMRSGLCWMVALAHQDLKTGDRQRSALMAIAVCTEDGQWAIDGIDGLMMLPFTPNWFAEPPANPPWPPPDVPMPKQPSSV